MYDVYIPLSLGSHLPTLLCVGEYIRHTTHTHTHTHTHTQLVAEVIGTLSRAQECEL